MIVLAGEPNVWMKVSYFPEAAGFSEKYPFPWAKERFRELFERVGSQRMVWGSNYPPVLTACSYNQALAFVRDECLE